MSRSVVELLLDADCSLVEKMILQVVARHGKGSDGSGGYPSIRRIALMSRISTSTTRGALGAMRKKKWLSWSSGNAQENKANEYTIHLDAIPMLHDLWRSPLQPSGDQRYSPVADPVATIATDLWRSEAKPVATTATQASTEVNTNTKNSLSSSGDDAVSESSSSSKPKSSNGKISASASDLDEYVHRWNTRCAPTLQAVKNSST